jgi:hypothetical protein
VSDPARPGERFALQPGFEIFQFAFGSAAAEMAVFHSCDAGGIISAIFQTLERIDQMPRDRFAAENSHNSAHYEALASPPRFRHCRLRGIGADEEIKIHVVM